MMPRVLFWLLLLLPGTALAQAPACNADGSQMEMNACAADAFNAADRELNAVYRNVQQAFADQPVFLKKLRVAQRHWIAFRDAELEARFPVGNGENARVLYGSMYPMCVLGEKERLTRERIAQLRKWLDGAEEGDGCAGSIPIRQD